MIPPTHSVHECHRDTIIYYREYSIVQYSKVQCNQCYSRDGAPENPTPVLVVNYSCTRAGVGWVLLGTFLQV